MEQASEAQGSHLCIRRRAIARRGLKTLERLNGRKVLVRGNHDIFKLQDYAQYFDDIRGCFYHHEFMMSHIPLHPELFEQRFKGNIHGHLHSGNVRLPDGSLDRRYLNCCVEQHKLRAHSLGRGDALFLLQ
jgi:calcineurin-like phosphoesterase family protein